MKVEAFEPDDHWHPVSVVKWQCNQSKNRPTCWGKKILKVVKYDLHAGHSG